MTLPRRRFVQLSLAAAAMTACGTGPKPLPEARSSPARKKLLVLGGTSFLGPAFVTAARARGHVLTLFNRGKTHPELFPDVEKLHGDRDPNKDEGLQALAGRSFDAVLDTSGYFPRMVRASAEILAPRLGQYVFISSISAYKKNDTPGMDETAETATLADPSVESMGKSYENYGGLKSACEQAARQALPGRVTVVRPGFIVGPDDPSDRFTFFPARYARGGEMLAPGSPSDPLQIIDVRDLAEWLVLLMERGTMGVFNAMGPEQSWSMGGLFEACREITHQDTKLTWVPGPFLVEQGEDGTGTLPLWTPTFGTFAGMHQRSNARAVAAGLRFRSPIATTRDTLAWFEGLPPERRDHLRAGPSPQHEAELLARWNQSRTPTGKPG